MHTIQETFIHSEKNNKLSSAKYVYAKHTTIFFIVVYASLFIKIAMGYK